MIRLSLTELIMKLNHLKKHTVNRNCKQYYMRLILRQIESFRYVKVRCEKVLIRQCLVNKIELYKEQR